MPCTLAITGCGSRWIALHQLGADVEQPLEERHVAADHLAQVVAGRERGARGLDDDRARRRVRRSRAAASSRSSCISSRLSALRFSGRLRVTRAAGPSSRTSTVAPGASVLIASTIRLYRRFMSSQTNGAASGVSASWPTRTGVNRTELDPTSFLHRSATIHPGRVAVVDGDLRRTYAELHERVARLASALRARGLERHDRVAALCPNVPELLELHHAVPSAGGVLVAINVRLSAREIGYILEHSGSRGAVRRPRARAAGDRGAGRARGRARSATTYERSGRRSGDPAGVPSLLRDEEEPIAINYTSGTTGRPKGVVYTLPRRVPQRARRGDRGRARPPPASTCGRCRCSTATAGASPGR